MRAYSYNNNGYQLELPIEFIEGTTLRDALASVQRQFPEAILLVDGNKFKWLKNGESRIIISDI